MRVVVNLLPTLRPKTGVGHYAARLFAALQAQLPPDDLHDFPTGVLAAALRRRPVPEVGGSGALERLTGLARAYSAVKGMLRTAQSSCIKLAFRAACRRNGYDLYHEPNFIPLATGLSTVVTVHDLSVVLHPEWHPTDRVQHHERHFRCGLSDAVHILTDTRFVRRQVIEHLGIAAERVTAVHLGVGPEYFAAGPAQAEQARQALGLPPDYLLYVGTIEPRKNVLTLLRAYCDLPEGLRHRCPLVLAGGWGWRSADVADYLRTDAADRGVRHIGYTDDDHLPGLYAGARALVYPSLYEGFGLPPLEMLACGGVVLSSTAGALCEVLGRHAHFVEPLDTDGWRAALERAIRDDDWIAELRRGGKEYAARFRWERCAAETVGVYRSLLAPTRQAA